MPKRSGFRHLQKTDQSQEKLSSSDAKTASGAGILIRWLSLPWIQCRKDRGTSSGMF
ncbi:hypothetical protein [Tropicimonas sp. S265A]|uniref:hypothetical protein n=1 Tax=Tropicimonas sp. S265A TaxID=3415134 RepID=UPI003C79DB9C